MTKNYRIELDEHDLGQILDGLEVRVESWRRTAEYLRAGDSSEGELFPIEEYRDEDEASWLASRYETIIKSIQSQIEALQ